MNCSFCGSPLYPGRAVFKCYCKALIHGYCWEKHVLESHMPLFVVGTITLYGEFKPKKPEKKEDSPPKGSVALAGKQKVE